MDNPTELSSIVKQVVESYARPAHKAKTYALSDVEKQQYAVTLISEEPSKIESGIVVMARIIGDSVIIESDTTDRPLYKELEHAGISREKIILAYAGENVPETT